MEKKNNTEKQEINLKNNIEPSMLQPNPEIQAQIEKTKKDLDKITKTIIKKYPYIQSISVIPQQANKIFVENEHGENIQKAELEKLSKKIHLYTIIPEEKLKTTKTDSNGTYTIIPEEKRKEIDKLSQDIITEAEKLKQDIWIHIKTPSDIWGACMESKFDLVNAIGTSLPLHDKGILQALRVAQIHKTLVLQRFEKYVVSYVIAGSMVRGEDIKTSDVDVFVIVDDTDVRNMSRLELKERLRQIINQNISEASALAGVKENMLNVQTYLLTDFWESVKDANPVIFTFIRDGIPLYDRKTFLPWKILLRMGKLKPSPESIDMFMATGNNTVKKAKATLMNILIQDIYWGVITPSQALLMLYGLPPPTPKQTIKEMRSIFVEKEKIMETKFINILERIVTLYKDFEHEKLKEIKGEKIDKLLKDTEEYLNRLTELRKQIEKNTQQQTIEQIHKDLMSLLETILKKKNPEAITTEFNKKLVTTGKFTKQHLKTIKDVISAKKESKKSKTDLHKTDKLKRDTTNLINDLIEYSQRKDLIKMEKGRMLLTYDKDKKAEILIVNGKTFLFKGNEIKKITNKTENSNIEEVNEAITNQKETEEIQLTSKTIEQLKKELGEFEIIM